MECIRSHSRCSADHADACQEGARVILLQANRRNNGYKQIMDDVELWANGKNMKEKFVRLRTQQIGIKTASACLIPEPRFAYTCARTSLKLVKLANIVPKEASNLNVKNIERYPQQSTGAQKTWARTSLKKHERCGESGRPGQVLSLPEGRSRP